MPKGIMGLTTFDRAGAADKEALAFVADPSNDPGFKFKEPVGGQTLLHLLLRNYVGLLGSSEPKDDRWLGQLKLYHDTIDMVLKVNPDLPKAKNGKGETPLEAAANCCPRPPAGIPFTQMFSQPEGRKRGADMIYQDAERCRSGDDASDKAALSQLHGRLF